MFAYVSVHSYTLNVYCLKVCFFQVYRKAYVNEFVLTKSNSFWLKELSTQFSEPSTKDISHQLSEVQVNSLGKLRIKNINRLFIGTLNINSVSCKFDQLKRLLQGKVDIIILIKVNWVLLFKQTNFLSKVILSSLDLIETRTEVVGILLYIREDLPCKELKLHRHPSDNEGIFVEVNLRKTKWLLFATYPTPSQVDELFFFFWWSRKKPRQV